MALPAILMGLIPGLVGKATDMIDKKFQTESEKEAAVRDFETKARQDITEAWNEEQRALTERHKHDMNSDSWLSKNVRPLVLIYLMGLFTLAFFKDVPAVTLELLSDLLMTAFIFYFGARALEKITQTVRK